MKELTIIILLTFSVFNIFSQEAVEEIEKDIDSSEPVQEIKSLIKVKHNLGSNYEAIKINDNCAYYHKKRSNKYGILKNGKKILPDIFYYQITKTNHVILGVEKLYGLYNLDTEQWDIPVMYSNIECLYKNYYRIQKDRKYYLIDSKNNKVIEEKFNSVFSIKSQYIKVNNGKYGVYNLETKKYVIKCKYNKLNRVGNSLTFSVSKNNTYNIVDVNDNEIFKEWYQYIHSPYGIKNKFIVKLNDKIGIIDSNEKIITPIEFKKIDNYRTRNNSHISIDKNDKYGCLDINGNITLPFKYDKINKTTSSYSIAQIGNKYGIITFNDSLPKEEVSCIYDSIIPNDFCIILKLNNKYGLLDKAGNVGIVEYDTIIHDRYRNSYGGGTALISIKDKLYYLLNTEGKVINKNAYANISFINAENYPQFAVKNSDNKYGVVDTYGKEITPIIYDQKPFWLEQYFICVNKNNKIGVYDIKYKKKLIIPIEYDYILPYKDKKNFGTYFIGIKGNDYYKILVGSTVTVRKI